MSPRTEQALRIRRDRRSLQRDARALQKRVPSMTFSQACGWIRAADRRASGVPE